MIETLKADFGKWHVHCIPEDGARISVLKYEGFDLLTPEPALFMPPEIFYGEYETRPVYGYDDCFPSVDRSVYPGEEYECRDHGEICWNKWSVVNEGTGLICHTICRKPATDFKRILYFEGDKLTWRFEVKNLSDKKLTFLHVMHALLPLDQIRSIKLPHSENIVDEIKTADYNLKDPGELEEDLLRNQSGNYKMLLLNKISDGLVSLGFHNGLSLSISFDKELFPTIGIWWNHKGYPEEEGHQRTECAFEPIPGSCSSLSASFRDGLFLSAGPGEIFSWEIIWTINH